MIKLFLVKIDMKQNFKILLFICLAVLSSCLQNPLNITESPVIKTITKYEVDSLDNIIRVCFVKEFDITGHLIKFIEYEENGRTIEHNYEVISKNLIIEKVLFFGSQNNIDSITIKENFYNEKNQISKIITFNQAGDTLSLHLYDYNNSGNITEIKEIDLINKLKNEKKFSYKFNGNGELVGIEITFSGSDTPTQFEQIEYLSNFRQVRSQYYLDGNLKTIKINTYNSLGLLISELYLNPDNSFQKKFKYEYAFFQ